VEHFLFISSDATIGDVMTAIIIITISSIVAVELISSLKKRKWGENP